MRTTHRILRYTKSALLAVAVCMLVACGPGASDTELVETAKNYMAENQIREAALELKNALQSNPDNAEARYLLGKIQLDVGDIVSAEKEFRRSAELGWIAELVNVDLARTLLLQRKFKEMIKDVTVGEGWSQTATADLFGLRAVAEASMGKLDKAKKTLAEGATYKADALYMLKAEAQLQLLEGHNSKAISTLNKAIKLYPDSIELQLLAANAAIIDSDVVSARGFYDGIIASQPVKLITRNGRKALIGVTRLNILDRKYEQAHKTLDPLVAMNPNDPEANYLAGVLAFEEKDYDKAEINLRKILKLAPNHEQTLLLFGAVSYAKGEYEQAAYYLSKYLSTGPVNLKARKLLGQTYMALEQHEKAETALRSALDENSEDAELLALVGLSALRSGQVQAGIFELEKAVSLAPESSALRSELAKAYMSKGDTEQAINEFEKVIASGKGAYRAQVMVVFAYLRDKKYEKALASSQKMLDEYPDDATITNLMGIVQHSSGNKEAGRQYFEKTLQIDPNHTGAAINLARLDEKAGDIENAKKRYLAIIDTAADNTTVLMSLARLAESQDDKSSQVKWLERVRAADKKDVASRIVLVEYYIQNKNLAEADKLVKEMEAEHAGKPVVLIARAELLIARESYNQAVPVINELIELKPDMFVGYYLNGLNQLKMGQIQGAKASLIKANELNPKSLQNLTLLAQVRLGSQELEEALKLGQQIKQLAPEKSAGFVIIGDAHAGLQRYPQALENYSAAWQIEQTSGLVLRRFQVNRKINSNDISYAVISDWLVEHADDHLMRFKLAEAYQQDGLADKATIEYENILKLQPDNVVVLNNLAWLYNKRGDSRALEYAENAFKLNKSAAIKDTYGWVLLKNNKIEHALKLLTEALRDLPDVPDVKYHHAVALYESGDKQAAFIVLEELLATDAKFDGRADARVLLNKK